MLKKVDLECSPHSFQRGVGILYCLSSGHLTFFDWQIIIWKGTEEQHEEHTTEEKQNWSISSLLWLQSWDIFSPRRRRIDCLVVVLCYCRRFLQLATCCLLVFLKCKQSKVKVRRVSSWRSAIQFQFWQLRLQMTTWMKVETQAKRKWETTNREF